MPPDRAAALSAAIQLHQLVGGLHTQCGVDRTTTVDQAETAVRKTADVFAAWLAGTTRLHLTLGPVVDETTGVITPTIDEGATMQINTGQKFDVTADTEDASGYDTPETIVWSIDNSDVASLVVSSDSKTCTVVSGAPGSAVLTATLPNLDPPLSATLAVDVVPAGTATIDLVAGDPVDE